MEVFRRDATGHWVLYPFGPGETVEFASIDLHMPIDAVYEDVQWEDRSRLPE